MKRRIAYCCYWPGVPPTAPNRLRSYISSVPITGVEGSRYPIETWMRNNTQIGSCNELRCETSTSTSVDGFYRWSCRYLASPAQIQFENTSRYVEQKHRIGSFCCLGLMCAVVLILDFWIDTDDWSTRYLSVLVVQWWEALQLRYDFGDGIHLNSSVHSARGRLPLAVTLVYCWLLTLTEATHSMWTIVMKTQVPWCIPILLDQKSALSPESEDGTTWNFSNYLLCGLYYSTRCSQLSMPRWRNIS